MIMQRIPRRSASLLGLATLLVLAVIVVAGSHGKANAKKATKNTVRVAATPATDVAAEDPVLQQLQKSNPRLNLDQAVLVLNDAAGRVWATMASDGEMCLIERPSETSADGPVVTSRFGCRDSDVAAREGVVVGIPGRWVALGPSASRDVANHAIRQGRGAVRVAADASSVTLDGHTTELVPAP